MLFRDRPLSPTLVDAKLYLARPGLESQLLRPLEQGRNVLLIGDAGSGKTTIMRQLAGKLQEGDREVVWLNASLADSSTDLLEMAVKEMARGAPSPLPLGEEADGSFRLLTLSRALAAHPPAVIVLDNLIDPDVSFDLFGRLRDELWAAGHVWLVAARPKDSSAFRSPPAEAFWGAVVEIPPLNEHEVLEFLHKGLNDDEIAHLRKIPLAGFHPRLLIRELQSALEEDPEAKEARIGGLLRRAAKLGRSEELALRELIGLGRPASAHDPDLLASLGWSRSYAQRIFSHLESNRLVRSLPEASGERAGRPRKLYEPSPSAPA